MSLLLLLLLLLLLTVIMTYIHITLEVRIPSVCPPPLFLDQTEARKAEKRFLETAPTTPPPLPTPLSQGLDQALTNVGKFSLSFQGPKILKTESITNLSNFNFQWTKTLYKSLYKFPFP